MIHNKKGTEVTFWLVGIMITVIVALSLFAVLPKIIGILQKGGEHQSCALSGVLEHATKLGGLRTVATLDCPYEKKEFTLKDLNYDPGGITTKINAHNAKFKGQKGMYTELDPQVYNLNEYIAKEMKTCWEKLGEGQLNLFPEWWNLIGGDYRTAGDAILGWGKKEPPRFCVICSRIRFDSEVRRIIQEKNGGTVTSLWEWMGNNELPKKPGLSYLQYLEDDLTKGMFNIADRMAYKLAPPDMPDRPLAVVYVQTNVWKGQKLFEEVLQATGISDNVDTVVHQLKLIPFDETQKECTVLEG